MARIYIFGEKNPIIVPYERAVKIQSFIDDPAIPKDERVKIGEDFSGIKADIRRVWLDREEYKSKMRTESPQDEMKDYRDYRKQVQALPMKDRAKQTGFFTLLFYTYMHRKPNAEELKKAEKLQQMFFEDNPFRIVPDPIIFAEELIPDTSRPNFSATYIRPALGLDARYAEKESNYYASMQK